MSGEADNARDRLAQYPDGYEPSFLPQWGGAWSKLWACKRCGAIVLGKSVAIHNTFHGSVPGPDASGVAADGESAPIGPESAT